MRLCTFPRISLFGVHFPASFKVQVHVQNKLDSRRDDSDLECLDTVFMASKPLSELTIVGNRPEPWNEFIEFMKSFGLQLKHEVTADNVTGKKVLAFHAPIHERIDDIKERSKAYESIICDGLFAKESWDLLAQLLIDIASQRFEKLGELLQNPAAAQAVDVTSAKNRHGLKDDMVTHLKGLKVRTTITDRCFQVAEEMLMNAIYDAPVDQGGKSLYNHVSRKDDIILKPEQFSRFEYCTKNNIVAISVTDPFGGLTRETLVNYLDSCYKGQAGSLNKEHEKAGAGRGLHMIVENADLTVFQVKRGFKTRVVSYFWQRENPFGENPQLSFTYFD